MARLSSELAHHGKQNMKRVKLQSQTLQHATGTSSLFHLLCLPERVRAPSHAMHNTVSLLQGGSGSIHNVARMMMWDVEWNWGRCALLHIYGV